MHSPHFLEHVSFSRYAPRATLVFAGAPSTNSLTKTPLNFLPISVKISAQSGWSSGRVDAVDAISKSPS